MFRRLRNCVGILLVLVFLFGCGAQKSSDPINWGTQKEESFGDAGWRAAPPGFIQSCTSPSSEVADEDCVRGGFKK